MAGPARAGVVVYAQDLDQLARFYEGVAGMRRLHADRERIVLASDDAHLVVHAAFAPMSDPGAPRADAAFKPFFTVNDLDHALTDVAALGGIGLPGRWSGPGFEVCNACDPEGNIIQLRAFA